MVGAFIKREDKEIHKRIRVELQQVKENQEPPEAGRGKEEFFPRAKRRSIALLTS